MKHIFTYLVLVIGSFSCAFGQAKKPSIMVVPSDNWCISQGYFTEHEVYGTVRKIPNFRQALQESSDLMLVISKINEINIIIKDTLKELFKKKGKLLLFAPFFFSTLFISKNVLLLIN